MHRFLLIAGLVAVAACTPSSITNNLSADEEGITMRKTGFDLSRANQVAAEHCQDYGKQAVLVSFGGYTIKYRCAEGTGS